MPLSVAAACSSMLNERQNFLRSAKPHARLMRAPNGVCRISCIPPPSSKKRSATIVVSVGTVPSIALPARTYATACSAPARSRAHSSISHFTARASSRSSIARAQRDLARELDRAPGPFAVPERNRGRRTVRVLDDAHDAGFDAPDLPRRRAEQEDVAGHALDREVFVERADHVTVGLDDDVVVGRLGNRAARGDRRHARAAPRAQPAVDAIVVQNVPLRPREVAMPSASIVTTSSKSARGDRGTDTRCEPSRRASSVPQSSARSGDDLLREDVERRSGCAARPSRRCGSRARAPRTRAARRASSRRCGLRAARRPSGRSGRCAAARPRSSAASRAERPGRRADVDAELERGGRDDASQLAVLELGLGRRSASRAPRLP
jgi:hypothetical protein